LIDVLEEHTASIFRTEQSAKEETSLKQAASRVLLSCENGSDIKEVDGVRKCECKNIIMFDDTQE
jgi:hypothetical protein